jgi:hypothetical protein
MFAYYIIFVYIIQMFDKFALILALPIAIGIVYRFYVNHDSKYLHVRFVVCAGGSIMPSYYTCLNYNSVWLHMSFCQFVTLLYQSIDKVILVQLT